MQKSDIFRIPQKGMFRNTLIVMIVALLLMPASAVLAEGGGITVIPDWTVFIQIVNFLFLIFIMNMLLFKPIRKMLLERKDKIDGLEESIESTQNEAVTQDEAFADGLKEARGKGLKQKESLLQEASDQEKAIVDKINEKAQADLTEVRTKIAKETEAVKATLIGEVDSFADVISEKILGRAV